MAGSNYTHFSKVEDDKVRLHYEREDSKVACSVNGTKATDESWLKSKLAVKMAVTFALCLLTIGIAAITLTVLFRTQQRPRLLNLGEIGATVIQEEVHEDPARVPDALVWFWARNVFENDCDTPSFYVERGSNYYLAPSGFYGVAFTIDLQREYQIHAFKLRNAHNGNHKDRATKGFAIAASIRRSGPYREIVNGVLEDSRRKDCSKINIETFYPERVTTARFLRFIVKSVYQTGASLQYLAVVGNEKAD